MLRETDQIFDPPHRALWELTWRCDLRCAHCLVRGGEGRDELGTDEALEVVDQLADLGVRAVSLTGGEPLLRKDWPLIARRIRERGMILRWSLNGHLLGDDVLDQFQELGTEQVVVSIDGTRETHDRLRSGQRQGGGRSSFDRVITALDRLARTEIIAGVITTVTRDNLGQLGAIQALLRDHGVQRWHVQLAHRTGRLKEDGAGLLPLAPEQLPVLATWFVEAARDPVLPPIAHNSIGYLGAEEPLLRSSGRRRPAVWSGCVCGVRSMGIEPDGGIKGCANQVGAPFGVGNVRTESLRHIWNDRPRWHWLSPTPEQMEGECADCALAAVCGAGCTALAHSASGRLFDNPYCLRRVRRSAVERGGSS